MTRVQELKDQIYLIQSSCSHGRWEGERPIPVETLVPGIFIGHTAGPIQVRDYYELIRGGQETQGISLTCSDCSKTLKGSISGICPKCLINLGEGRMAPGFRERYFGMAYMFYGIMLKSCPGCNFTVARDEWDQ